MVMAFLAGAALLMAVQFLLPTLTCYEKSGNFPRKTSVLSWRAEQRSQTLRSATRYIYDESSCRLCFSFFFRTCTSNPLLLCVHTYGKLANDMTLRFGGMAAGLPNISCIQNLGLVGGTSIYLHCWCNFPSLLEYQFCKYFHNWSHFDLNVQFSLLRLPRHQMFFLYA